MYAAHAVSPQHATAQPSRLNSSRVWYGLPASGMFPYAHGFSKKVCKISAVATDNSSSGNNIIHTSATSSTNRRI